MSSITETWKNPLSAERKNIVSNHWQFAKPNELIHFPVAYEGPLNYTNTIITFKK